MGNDEQGTRPVTPTSALPVGTRLEEYIIRSVVGEGGFGIVYLAHDTLLDREVAIKEYLPGTLATRGAGKQVEVRLADKRELFQKGMRRFVNEAHILAKFRHPALVSVMRFLETNGTAYMVMPYYRGKTLREMVRNGYRAKTTEDLFTVLLPVLEGLSQLHSVRCYHLDISSDNILILENGAPVLLDFGAARHTELSGEDPTTIILKPGFAPIEQYSSGDNGLMLGPWTDIYAISAVAYLLVSGMMPTVSVSRIMRDTVKPLADSASPDLPADVLKVIDLGLAVRPEDRPMAVVDYRHALLEAADDAPVPLEQTAPAAADRHSTLRWPPSSPDAERSSARLRWGILFAALLAVILLLFFLLGSTAQDREKGRGPSPEIVGSASPAASGKAIATVKFDERTNK